MRSNAERCSRAGIKPGTKNALQFAGRSVRQSEILYESLIETLEADVELEITSIGVASATLTTVVAELNRSAIQIEILAEIRLVIGGHLDLHLLTSDHLQAADVISHVADAVVNVEQQGPHVSRVAVYMTLAIRSGMFHSINQIGQVSMCTSQITQVGCEVIDVAIDVRYFVNMRGQSSQFPCIVNDMLILRGMGVVAGFTQQQICFILNLQCEFVDVLVVVCRGDRSKT
jgi:hypothetical protein